MKTANGSPRGSTEALLVTALAATFVTAWAVMNGRDINWDFINYHVYTGFASLNDRLHQDYFPANIQSYLLGYAYVPLYLAIKANLDTWAVQAMLGLMCLPTLVAAWLVALRVFPGNRAADAGWRLAMVLAAGSSPLFLMELGTSFADSWTAAFVLFPCALLLREGGATARGVFWAGLLAGVGGALKMTNIPMVAALPVVIVVMSGGDWKPRLKLVALFVAGCAVAFLAVYGWWGWRLYERFGNPFFPLFLNEWFRPAEFPQYSLSLDRFKPASVADFLLRPLYMFDIVGGLYTERGAPDTRYAGLFALGIGYLVQLRLRHVVRNMPVEAMTAWCAITWTLWMLTSGNGRYAVPLAMIAGMIAVAIARLLWHARSPHLSAIKAACIALVAAHLVSLTIATNFRWDGRFDDQAKYFAPKVAHELLDKPHVILNLDNQSISWLAAYVHPESVFISPVGQHTIKPGSVAGERVKQALHSGMPVLVSFKSHLSPDFSIDDAHTKRRRQMGPQASLYGLEVDWNARCHPVAMDTLLNPRQDARPDQDDWVVQMLLLCPARYSESLSADAARRFARHDAALDRIEDACPRLFSPPRTQSLCTENFCGRIYMNSDTSLQTHEDGGIVALGFNGIQPAFMGYKDDILAGKPIQCGNKPGRYHPFTAGGSVSARPD